MKRSLPLPLLPILLISINTSIQGQIEYPAIPAVTPGDTMERFVQLMPDGVEITAPGEDQSWNWDLDDMQRFTYEVGANDRPGEFPGADIRITTGINSTYYSTDSSIWSIHGLFGEDPVGLGQTLTSFYTPPLPDITAPLGIGDSAFHMSTVYAGIPRSVIPDTLWDMLPITPDSLRVAVRIQQEDTIDASGMLTINGKTYSALRQCRTQRFAVGIEAKISILPWTDVTQALLEFIGELPVEISLSDTTYAYRFLSEGYSLPVAIVRTDIDRVPLSVEYAGEMTSAIAFPDRQIPVLMAFPNPAGESVSIQLPGQDHAVVNIAFYQHDGRVVKSLRTSINTGTLEIALDGTPEGTLFFTVRSDTNQILGTGKIVRIGN